jgi:hypothetical protein
MGGVGARTSFSASLEVVFRRLAPQPGNGGEIPFVSKKAPALDFMTNRKNSRLVEGFQPEFFRGTFTAEEHGLM